MLATLTYYVPDTSTSRFPGSLLSLTLSSYSNPSKAPIIGSLSDWNWKFTQNLWLEEGNWRWVWVRSCWVSFLEQTPLSVLAGKISLSSEWKQAQRQTTTLNYSVKWAEKVILYAYDLKLHPRKASMHQVHWWFTRSALP